MAESKGLTAALVQTDFVAYFKRMDLFFAHTIPPVNKRHGLGEGVRVAASGVRE